MEVALVHRVPQVVVGEEGVLQHLGVVVVQVVEAQGDLVGEEVLPPQWGLTSSLQAVFWLPPCHHQRAQLMLAPAWPSLSVAHQAPFQAEFQTVKREKMYEKKISRAQRNCTPLKRSELHSPFFHVAILSDQNTMHAQNATHRPCKGKGKSILFNVGGQTGKDCLFT